jgi:glycosyltransferase involved in cell wall biosynthesis
MFDFVAAYRRVCRRASLLVLTTDERGRFEALGRAKGVPCTIMAADRRDMPSLLSAADVGLSFILPAPSKRACSPVKNGEYLACGLPLVSTSGIGDYSDLVARMRVGVTVASVETLELENAARNLEVLLAEPGLMTRCRRVARESLDLHKVLLPRYSDLYRRLLGPGTGGRASAAGVSGEV